MESFVAVCIASRGTGHIRTLAGAIREAEPYPHVWCWAFGLPIPEAQNACAAQALADPRVTHLWWVEDDMLIPAGALAAMLAADAPIVGIDYLTRTGSSITSFHPETGAVLLTGMGCLLVRREVYDVLPHPPYRVEAHQILDADGRWAPSGQATGHGGQDAAFCRRVAAAGIPIVVLPGWQAGHLDVVRPGHRLSNAGYDVVRCVGGRDVPYRPEDPEEVDTMNRKWIRSPNGQTVIDQDLDNPENQFDWWLRQGWVEITEAEAMPLLERQRARDAAMLERQIAAAAAEDDADDW